jgi:outer membrane receptor protein involved in Fe transport
MELAAGVRYENHGRLDAFAPKVDVTWSPVHYLGVRGTWGRAVRLPTLTEQSEASNPSTVTMLPDASSHSGYTPTLVWTGNNADLHPEHARTWTAGVDVTAPDVGRSFGLPITRF